MGELYSRHNLCDEEIFQQKGIPVFKEGKLNLLTLIETQTVTDILLSKRIIFSIIYCLKTFCKIWKFLESFFTSSTTFSASCTPLPFFACMGQFILYGKILVWKNLIYLLGKSIFCPRLKALQRLDNVW